MKVIGIGVESWLLVLAIYMVVTVVATEYLKKVIKLDGLCISWIVGILVFLILIFLDVQFANFMTLCLFVVMTGLLNAGYRFTNLKKWVRRLLGTVKDQEED
jgi:uncharacterized membrane protein